MHSCMHAYMNEYDALVSRKTCIVQFSCEIWIKIPALMSLNFIKTCFKMIPEHQFKRSFWSQVRKQRRQKEGGARTPNRHDDKQTITRLLAICIFAQFAQQASGWRQWPSHPKPELKGSFWWIRTRWLRKKGGRREGGASAESDGSWGRGEEEDEGVSGRRRWLLRNLETLPESKLVSLKSRKGLQEGRELRWLPQALEPLDFPLNKCLSL